MDSDLVLVKCWWNRFDYLDIHVGNVTLKFQNS